jgi:ACS family hexuronate transporter-like MFS transporter
MMLVSIISYIDRNTLALLAPTILKDIGLTNQQYGYIVAAFSVSYCVANPIWGRILDRIGVHKGMAFSVGLWTLASVSHVFAKGMGGFALARGALGFGEGATFPGALRTVAQTLPPELRSRGTALSYSGGSLGAIVTPLILAPVAARWGWRGAFWFTGLIGALWLGSWLWIGKDTGGQRRPATSDAVRMRWTDAQLWAFLGVYALGSFPLGFVLYQASIYLSVVLHQTQATINLVLWIPPLGWEAGYFFWGWVADRLTSAGSSIPAMRLLFVLLTLLSLPIALIPRLGSLRVTLVMMFLAMFVTAGFIILSVANATARYSIRYSGLIAGLGAGTWSGFVAIAMPLIGRLFDQRRYELAFLLTALMPVAGLGTWLWVNRNSSLGDSSCASSLKGAVQ